MLPQPRAWFHLKDKRISYTIFDKSLQSLPNLRTVLANTASNIKNITLANFKKQVVKNELHPSQGTTSFLHSDNLTAFLLL